MTDQKTLTSTAWLLLASLGLIWGTSFLAIRIALDEVPVLSSVAHRVLWAALLLWAVALWRRETLPRSWQVWAAFLVMGLLNNVLPFSLMAWGQLHIETGLTAILNAATAVWGVLVAALFFADERLSARRLTGVILGFLGVAVAIGLENMLSFDLRSVAQLAVIGGTLSYALAGAWARRTLSGQSPVVAAAGMLTASTLIMLPVARVVDGPLPFDLAPLTWAAVLHYAIICTGLAYLLYYRVLALAGSGNLMLVTLLVAPVAIILGAIVRGEALSPQAYFGFALLALGLVMLDGRFARFRRPPV